MKKTFLKSDYKHKQWFRANIDGKDCIGRVSISGKSGKVYLCQNDQDGSSAPDKLGFHSSWCVETGSTRDLKKHDVKNLVLLSRKPASFKMPVVLPAIGSYSAKITSNGEVIKVGCTPVSRELYLKVGRMAGWIE